MTRLAGACATLLLALPSGALARGAGGGAASAAGGAAAPQQTQSQSPAEAPTPAPPAAETEVSGIPTPVHRVAVDRGAVRLTLRSAAIVGQDVAASGAAPARDAGEEVTLERLDATRGLWLALTHARVRPGGAFNLEWKADVAGRLSLRAVVGSSPQAPAAGAALSQSSGAAPVTIYHAGVATYYGPGFYGQRTACGQIMTPQVVGVANRTLPCGTLVAVSYGSQTLVVPVIDRGPYHRGVSWDLTSRVAGLLGAEGKEQVGTMIVGSVPNTPLLGQVPGPHGSPTGGSEASPAA
jgi:hypothetical protein